MSGASLMMSESMTPMIGARWSAIAISPSERWEIGRPLTAALMVAWLSRAACARLWGVKNSDHPCDLRLRPNWLAVRSMRIAFLEGPSEALPPTGVDEI